MHAGKVLTALRVALRICERYGEIMSNPCSGVRVPTEHDATERPARILTPEELAAIVAAAAAEDAALADRRRKRHETAQAAALLGLLGGTGLRLGEALALVWGQRGLDLDAGVVHVRASLDRERGEDGRHALVPPKSRASRRSVPVPADELERLAAYRATAGGAVDGLVFANRYGETITANGWPRQVLARACTAANISEPRPRVHDLRHAYATHLLRAGLTAHAVARLLGHADAGLVWRRYGHALPDELELAAVTLHGWRAERLAQDRHTKSSQPA